LLKQTLLPTLFLLHSLTLVNLLLLLLLLQITLS
jgi:hypothetical protein